MDTDIMRNPRQATPGRMMPAASLPAPSHYWAHCKHTFKEILTIGAQPVSRRACTNDANDHGACSFPACTGRTATMLSRVRLTILRMRRQARHARTIPAIEVLAPFQHWAHCKHAPKWKLITSAQTTPRKICTTSTSDCGACSFP